MHKISKQKISFDKMSFGVVVYFNLYRILEFYIRRLLKTAYCMYKCICVNTNVATYIISIITNITKVLREFSEEVDMYM